MNHTYNVDYCYTNSKKLNILIVDDDIISAELFKDILESYGHSVKTLDEGVKCLSNCMKNKYDIIFLDYHIGDIDGVELADCLKDVLKSEAIIYAYTGDNSTLALKKFKEIGPLIAKKLTTIGKCVLGQTGTGKDKISYPNERRRYKESY